MGIDYGDKVKVLVFPDQPIATVKRRCSRDNRCLWVLVEGEKKPVRVREDEVEKYETVDTR